MLLYFYTKQREGYMENKLKEKNKENINDKVILWGDVVSIKDLIISIVIAIITTMGGHFLAPKNNVSLQLFFGLAGAVIGFIITSMIFKPKRIVEEE